MRSVILPLCVMVLMLSGCVNDNRFKDEWFQNVYIYGVIDGTDERTVLLENKNYPLDHIDGGTFFYVKDDEKVYRLTEPMHIDGEYIKDNDLPKDTLRIEPEVDTFPTPKLKMIVKYNDGK